MKKIFCLCCYVVLLHSLTIQTNKPLELKEKQGILVGTIIINNQLQDAKAIGSYQLSSNKKSVLFSIEKILKDDQIHRLSSRPSAIKQVKNKKIPKGSKIILAGENEEEIAQIFGLQARHYQNAKNSTANPVASAPISVSSPSGLGASDNKDWNASSGYYPPRASAPMGNNFYPLGTGEGGGEKDSASSTPNYTAQYCKTPLKRENTITLSVVDKNGNCYETQAIRDDTRCGYRYDFSQGVAIKQTQFYYVDKENKTQNIGGCVDLEGKAYHFALYADDTKCKLQITKDKLYGGGIAYVFQTQILFRGADGTLQVAKDCTDYAHVQEELLHYFVDTSSGTLKRVVNQYYTDPFSQKKIIINNGINSPYEFAFKEYQCGNWEYNDAQLEAYKKTQIKAYDEISGSYYDVTGCDYTQDAGKTGKITQKYTKIIEKNIDGKREAGDMNGEFVFEIQERELVSTPASVFQDCGWGRGKTLWYDRYAMGGMGVKARWKTTYKTTNIGNTIGWQRPKQEGEEEATIYYTSQTLKKIERYPLIERNDIHLDEDYLKFYEANEGYYKDRGVRTSKEFIAWQSQYYKKGRGSFCQIYSFWDKKVGESSSNCKSAWGIHHGYSCLLYNDYLKP